MGGGVVGGVLIEHSHSTQDVILTLDLTGQMIRTEGNGGPVLVHLSSIRLPAIEA